MGITASIVGTGLAAKGAKDEKDALKDQEKELKAAETEENLRTAAKAKETERSVQRKQSGGYMSSLGANSKIV